MGHIFMASEGSVRHKGTSKQNFVLQTKDDANKKSNGKPHQHLKFLKNVTTEINTSGSGENGIEIMNKKGKLFISKIRKKHK